MNSYTFHRIDGSEITVEANDETEARTRAMIAIWGLIPDDITPHAPKYNGYGLYLHSTSEASPCPLCGLTDDTHTLACNRGYSQYD